MENIDIAEALKREIGSGAILPGERLVEAQLCKRFAAGRGKIRDALKRLEHEGYIKITPYAGASAAVFTQKDVEQIYDLMGVLEGLSMLVATPTLSDEDIGRIESIIDQMESTEDKTEFFRLNDQFHNLLSSLGENATLINFMEMLRGRARVMGLKSLHNPAQVNASIKDHRKIFEAIKALKSTSVEKLIRSHYLKSKKRLIRYLNKTL